MLAISMDKLTLPNALSASRLLLAPLCLVAVVSDHWTIAACILLAAVLTDLLDGWLARRRNQTSPFGGALDHGSDAVFVTITLAGLAMQHVVPLLLPPLVILAFAQYLLDSKALAGQPLRASQIGRYNGIAYFVLAGFPLVQSALGLTLISMDVIYIAGWLLVATTITSMIDRLLALLRLPPSN